MAKKEPAPNVKKSKAISWYNEWSYCIYKKLTIRRL